MGVIALLSLLPYVPDRVDHPLRSIVGAALSSFMQHGSPQSFESWIDVCWWWLQLCSYPGCELRPYDFGVGALCHHVKGCLPTRLKKLADLVCLCYIFYNAGAT
jgi:hypothetical protein